MWPLSLFRSAETQSPPPKPIMALEALVKNALAYPGSYSSSTLTKIANQLDASDPMKTRLNEAIEKAKLVKPAKKAEPLPEQDEKYDLRQGFLSPEDFIATLKQKGESLTSVELNLPTDDVFAALVTYCPNLTTLSYNTPGLNVGNNTVTNAGLMNVANIPKLTTFRFCVDEMFGINEDGIKSLLSSPLFVNKIEHLYISLFLLYVADDEYAIIASYKSLQSLYLNGNITKPETLENNPLPSTLTRFEFNQYPYPGLITDKFLSTLPAGLTKLAIRGSWKKVSSDGLQAMIAKLSKLAQLGLSGDSVPSALVGCISGTLTSLELGDCSQLQPSDFVNVTNNLPNLVSLSYGNASNFNNDVPLPSSLKTFCLDHSKLYSFTALPNTLEILTISRIKYDYTIFKDLTRLTSLHTLRIINCEGFNDGALIPLINVMKSRLRFLELNGVSVTIEGAKKISECTKITTLVLNHLTAFTAENVSTLLSESPLQQRVVYLYIGDLEFNNDTIGAILSKFTSLKALFLMLNGFDAPKNLKLPSQAVISLWLGPSQYRAFQKIQK